MTGRCGLVLGHSRPAIPEPHQPPELSGSVDFAPRLKEANLDGLRHRNLCLAVLGYFFPAHAVMADYGYKYTVWYITVDSSPTRWFLFVSLYKFYII